MKFKTIKIQEKTKGTCDIINITQKVQEQLEGERFYQGQASLFVSGSTVALTTIEYEPGLVQDLTELMENIIPSDRKYHHDECWGDNNGFSHLRASLLGPSLQVPIDNGHLLLGTWQQIVLIDFDNRPRTREVFIQIMGEAE